MSCSERAGRPSEATISSEDGGGKEVIEQVVESRLKIQRVLAEALEQPGWNNLVDETLYFFLDCATSKEGEKGLERPDLGLGLKFSEEGFITS